MRNKFWIGIGFLLAIFIGWALTRGWDSLTKDPYIENSKDSESVTPIIDKWNQKYNEFMLARYFLGEVEAAEVDPDILRANTIVCNASIQEGRWNGAETLEAAPIDVLLFSLSENEVSFTDKSGNVKTYKLVYVYISPSPGQLSDNRMRSVSFSDKGEYWGNGNLQLIDEEGNATNLDITDGVGRFNLF